MPTSLREGTFVSSNQRCQTWRRPGEGLLQCHCSVEEIEGLEEWGPFMITPIHK